MKGKISKNGILYIERAGELKPQFCRRNNVGDHCNHFCPGFREPEKLADNNYVLELCHSIGVLRFTEFTDERGRGEE